jgi:hypothetical protein
MNIDIKKLVQTKFLAFAMKAFASLNKGGKLGHDKYLKHLAGALTRVAAGETKRLVISMPPRHGKTFMARFVCPRGSWRTTPQPRSSYSPMARI